MKNNGTPHHKKPRTHGRRPKIPRQRPGVRRPSAALDALRQQMDQEIEIGLAQLARGEKIPGAQILAEICERSRQRRSTQ
jgi:hypothetical protein